MKKRPPTNFTHFPFPDFPLVINRQPEQGAIGLHAHHFKELVIILGGRAVHYSGRDEYEIMAGDCFVVEEAHGYKNDQDLSLVNVLFIPERLPVPWGEARKLPGYHAFFALEPKYRKSHDFRCRLRFPPEELSRVSILIDDLEKEMAEHAPGYEIMATALFIELIGFIARAYTRMPGKDYAGLMGLSEVISHLERNFGAPVQIPELARMACMSESRLLRSFKAATGFSPRDYLIRLRIRHACTLMKQEALNITEAAYRAGFNDSNYFSRQFRRIMAMSPREYRLGRRPNMSNASMLGMPGLDSLRAKK